MSFACLEYLSYEDPESPTTLTNDGLYYPHYDTPHPTKDHEFQILLALDFAFVRRWLEKHPEHATEELQAIVAGKIQPPIGRMVEILEAMEKVTMAPFPNSPWNRYFRVSPPLDESRACENLWIYDEDKDDGVLAGRFEASPEDPTSGLFFDDEGKMHLTSHWAIRRAGEVAPQPPPEV